VPRGQHFEDDRFPAAGVIAAYPPEDPDADDEDPE
jgi:hypothetical protein